MGLSLNFGGGYYLSWALGNSGLCDAIVDISTRFTIRRFESCEGWVEAESTELCACDCWIV